MLQLTLLGSPSATLDGTPLTGKLLHKDLALLYYLAATGQPQLRASLAALLWGDYSESAARTNLRKSLSNLRQHLGNHVSIERDDIALVQMHCTVDLWEFERLANRELASSDLAPIQAAVALYRGDFLSGFSVHNAADYDRWVFALQERLRDLAVHMLATLASAYAANGELLQAIAFHRRGLELEPWREESHRELMLLLAKNGRRSEALAQYKKCREVLTAELGVQPDAQTTAVAEHIRDSEEPPAISLASQLHVAQAANEAGKADVPARGTGGTLVLSGLAPDLSPIVGRSKELAELTQLLVDPECRLVTIVGMGGIGKTRLALALAHEVSARFARVAMISLAPVTRATEILSTVGRALGVTAAMSEELVLEALRKENSQLLLILDNFDHLLPDGVVVLEQMLVKAPRLRCVVTSREILSTLWEWRFPLGELSFPAEPGVGDPASYSSVQLFLQIARRARTRHTPMADELDQIMRICRLVGGMPLGVELAASQVGSLSCAAIADQLAAGVERLASDLRDLPVRQRSLAASFDTSWATLSAQEQNVLARLSVIQGSFTLDAAMGIAHAAITDIIRLVDKSLLRWIGGEFYSLHEVIKQHAARKLALTPRAPDAAYSGYREYYIKSLDENLLRLENLLLLTDSKSRAQGAAAQLENYMQHLWYIWLNSKGQPDRSQTAMALTKAEQFNRAHVHGRVFTTWGSMATFVDRLTQATSTYSGVTAISLVWLPIIADHLTDMTDDFAAELDSLLPALVAECSVNGRLLAFPTSADIGMLWYRSDLLHKYGFAAPPVTWEALEQMAAVIQAGERAAGCRNFWGFQWLIHESESLTCTALEWQYSDGGGSIIERDGHISVANARAAAALARAAKWVGTISPPTFREMTEGDTIRAWENGETAFMRMWAANCIPRSQTATESTTAVTVLPRGSVCHAATLGGWPLAVPSSVRQRDEAVELIKEMKSPEAQRLRAYRLDGGLPALQAIYDDPAILAVHPFFPDAFRLMANGGLAVRPWAVAGELYSQVSNLYANTVTAILHGEVEAMQGLVDLERALAELGGWSTGSST